MATESGEGGEAVKYGDVSTVGEGVRPSPLLEAEQWSICPPFVVVMGGGVKDCSQGSQLPGALTLTPYRPRRASLPACPQRVAAGQVHRGCPGEGGVHRG